MQVVFVRFDIQTAVTVKVFWDVMLCRVCFTLLIKVKNKHCLEMSVNN